MSNLTPDSGRLAFYLRRPDGTEKRLAGDEVEAENVAQKFTFGTIIPGGHGSASLGLTRDPRIDYGDFDVFDEFLARGPGNESAFEGYDIEIPKSGDNEVQLVAAGWGAYLKDNPTFQEIYFDKDLNRFTNVPAARKVLMLGVNAIPNDGSVSLDPTTGLPCLDLSIEGNWLSPWLPHAEMLYDAGPSARIGRIYFTVAPTATTPDVQWYVQFLVHADANFWGAGLETTADVYTSSGAESPVIFTPKEKARYGMFEIYYPNTPAGQAGVVYKFQIRKVVVVGDHSVPIQMSGGQPAGVLASDVVADILQRAAPMLNFTLGTEGSIKPSAYAIPHLIYTEAVTPEDAILQASKYDVPDWGVYDNREFFWRDPSGGRLWVGRQGDSGCDLQDEGKQAEEYYNGVLVQFTDPSGKTFTVGPPGTGGCDYSDASLQDTSSTNPLNEHGRQRLGKVVVGAITTLSGAIQIGSRWLQEELAVSDRGTAVLTGFAQDSAGNYEPVWKIRAGDRIRFDDGKERRIIATNYDHEARTNTLTLDSTPHRVDALMEKMQVELVAVGLGT
jgi:hypothetical protein